MSIMGPRGPPVSGLCFSWGVGGMGGMGELTKRAWGGGFASGCGDTTSGGCQASGLLWMVASGLTKYT